MARPVLGPPKPAPIRTFALIPRYGQALVTNAVGDGATFAAREIGYLKIVWAVPKTKAPSEQISLVRSMVKAHVNGIAISCGSSAALKPAINLAVAAGIPVVCWETDSPDSKRAAFVGIDDLGAGRRLGELLKASLPQGGDVAILTGKMDATDLNRRIDGFREGIRGSTLNLITVYPCDRDVAGSAAIVRDYTRIHPNLKGWCFVGGRPLMAPPPGPFAGGKPGAVKVVSYGTLKPQRAYLQRGFVDALVGPKYYEWGSACVKSLDKLDRGITLPPLANSGMDVVTKGNVKAFTEASR